MRAFCEDGREFIRQAFNRAWDEPLAPVPPPKVRRTEQKEILAGVRPAPPTGPPRNRIGHFVMNLPDTAILFLDAFRGVLSRANTGERDLSGLYDEASMPMIHTHCFTRELEPAKAEEDIRQVSVPRKHMSPSESGGTEWPHLFQRVEEKIGHALGEDTTFHWVRSVAPQKEMYCVSFRLPHAVAFAS